MVQASSASSLTRGLAVFLFLQGLYALTSTGRVHVTDEASAFFQARALVETGALTVPQWTNGFVFYGQRDRRGRLRAPNGPFHAFAVAPYYLLGKLMAMTPGIPEGSRDLVLTFAVVLSSTTFSALAAVLFLTLLIRRGVPPPIAVAVALAVALGTPLFAYSAWLFSEPLAMSLMIGAALLTFGDSVPVKSGSAAVAGGLLGACILTRPAHALAVPLFVAAVLVRDGWRGLSAALALAGTAAVGLAIYLTWNVHLFGNPFDFGYPEISAGGKRINGFETPLVTGLAGLLLSPGKSIFVHAPLVLAAIPALPRLARLDRGLGFLAIAAPLTYLLFYARYTQWEGGYCVGPRYLLAPLPFLLLALAPSVTDARPAAWRRLFVLTAVGALVQSIGLATSFLEDQYENGYYDQQFTYRLGYAPLSSQSALFLRYLFAFLRGDSSSPLGTGFDRWFLFLHKAGVSWWPIGGAIVSAIVVTGCAGAWVVSGLGRQRTVTRTLSRPQLSSRV